MYGRARWRENGEVRRDGRGGGGGAAGREEGGRNGVAVAKGPGSGGGGETGCSAWMRAKMYFFFFSLFLYLPFERTVVGWITNPGLPPARSSLSGT